MLLNLSNLQIRWDFKGNSFFCFNEIVLMRIYNIWQDGFNEGLPLMQNFEKLP